MCRNTWARGREGQAKCLYVETEATVVRQTALICGCKHTDERVEKPQARLRNTAAGTQAECADVKEMRSFDYHTGCLIDSGVQSHLYILSLHKLGTKERFDTHLTLFDPNSTPKKMCTIAFDCNSLNGVHAFYKSIFWFVKDVIEQPFWLLWPLKIAHHSTVFSSESL